MDIRVVERPATVRRRTRLHKAGALTFALLLATATGPSNSAGDAKRGAQLFRQCMACHSAREGEHLTGPSLAHVWGRKAATGEGFQRYSDALKGAGLTWTDASLDKWLASPGKLVPGTTMTFPGIKEARDRADVIAFLKAPDRERATPPAEGGHGMARAKLALKSAPPEGQVRSIGYCGDTYTVETADGKKEKIWEFNLRFKSDSSSTGPFPGKPVVVGAGMQGDRASVVFASPKEISDFVKAACP